MPPALPDRSHGRAAAVLAASPAVFGAAAASQLMQQMMHMARGSSRGRGWVWDTAGVSPAATLGSTVRAGPV